MNSDPHIGWRLACHVATQAGAADAGAPIIAALAATAVANAAEVHV
jgi:hypothetical protein